MRARVRGRKELWANLLKRTVSGDSQPESIESFIEGQAFSQWYDLAPRPPPLPGR
jgi:hypothetical protein